MNANLVRALYLAIGVALSACAVGPNYERPRFGFIPSSWLGGKASPLTPSDTVVLNLPWWKALSDPTLDNLVTKALDGNLDLRIAAARVEEARASRLAAQAAFLPQVDASASGKRGNVGTGTTGQTSNLFEAGFDASWEIDLFGGTRRAAEAARANLAAKRAAEKQVRVSLLAELVRTYLDYRRLERQMSLTKQNLSSQRQTLAAVREQMNQGVSSLLEVSRVETQSAVTEANLPDLTAQLVATRNTLAVLIGSTPKDIIPLLGKQHGRIPVPSRSVVVNLPAAVIGNRPDIQTAEREFAVAVANQGVAFASLFPKLTLSSLFGLQNLTTGGSFDTWSAGGVIKLPLADFGRGRSAVRVAKARQKQALAAYEQAVRTALADVETSLVAYHQAQQRYRILRRAAASGLTAEYLARLQFEQGIATLTDVLAAQRERLDTENALAAAQAAVGQRYAALYKALGGGATFQPPNTPKK